MTRLVQDITARKVYELPDYDGPPERDILLIELCEHVTVCSDKCRHPNVQPGQQHVGNMLQIDSTVWNKHRDTILSEMWSSFPDMGEDDILQSSRNNYTEDAGKCFNRHNRPMDGCLDYKDDSKRIGNPSKHPWLMQEKPVYLCDFCPVKSTVQGKVFHKRGLYK